MNKKGLKSQKVESESKNTPGTICTPPRTKKDRGATYSREKSFRKIELLEFEE